jgi:hypothetical protein
VLDEEDASLEDAFTANLRASAAATNLASRGGAAVVPAVFFVAAFPKLTYKDVRARAPLYIKRLAANVTGAVDVSILALQGEDGGTGVLSRISFLSGGEAAAARFRKTMANAKAVERIWNAKEFGGQAHMEAFSHVCYVTPAGREPAAAAGLVPTLVMALALPSRGPSFVTAATTARLVAGIKKALLPQVSAVSTDWFVDDNDESSGIPMKPVFNIQVQGPAVDELEAFARKIGAIKNSTFASRSIWRSSAGLGVIHAEGGSMLPQLCMAKATAALDAAQPKITGGSYAPGSTTATVLALEPAAGAAPFKLRALAAASTGRGDDVICEECERLKAAAGGGRRLSNHGGPEPVSGRARAPSATRALALWGSCALLPFNTSSRALCSLPRNPSPAPRRRSPATSRAASTAPRRTPRSAARTRPAR